MPSLTCDIADLKSQINALENLSSQLESRKKLCENCIRMLQRNIYNLNAMNQ